MDTNAAILERNLATVFNERDPVRRMAAINSLYVPDPTLYEPENVVRGRQAISDTVGRLLANLPPDFVFTVVSEGSVHHQRGYVRWRAGQPGQPAMLSGVDVIDLEGDKIQALYVFIDTRPQ